MWGEKRKVYRVKFYRGRGSGGEEPCGESQTL